MTAEDRIDDLEYRLNKYHEWLAEAISQRDRLAMDAAWGVHFALNSSIAYGVLFLAFAHFVPQAGWLAGLGLGIGLIVVHVIVHSWSNGLRMKEVDTLAKLPDWEWKSAS